MDTDASFSTLLEFAANNDVESFKRVIELDLSGVDYAGHWYLRRIGSKQITQDKRTPLMLAATYGSLDVLKLIVALPEVDLNRPCGLDKWTPLHCAAFGGSINAVNVVALLLSAGANPNVADANGLSPNDVVVAHPKLLKSSIEDLLSNNLRVSNSPILSPSSQGKSPFSPSYSPKLNGDSNVSTVSEKKQYPIDPSLPDIRNSIYSTDEFRMFSFKIRPCSRAYSHDWTECPFAHPGENARRRDPRKFHYSCVPCPDFRKGTCRRSDMCEYAHGVFECWLHPAQYRTRLCKDGTSCARQVCFFAHTHDELRPLYVSTGSGLPSPRSSGSGPSFMDMALALSIFPGSPTGNGNGNGITAQTMSPTGNGMSWPQPNVPTLHLPGSNLQSSRLRSSLSARDILPDAFQRSVNRPNTTLTPSNLDQLFSSEMASSPRFKSGVLNQFQVQLSPINTSNTNVFSPRNVDHSLFQGSFGAQSSMSPTGSPMSARLSAIARDRQQRSLSSRDLNNGYEKWGSPTGNADWSGHFNGSSSFELRSEGNEPDLSWVQSLVKESPPEIVERKPAAAAVSVTGESFNSTNSSLESDDHSVLGALLERMRIDQLVT